VPGPIFALDDHIGGGEAVLDAALDDGLGGLLVQGFVAGQVAVHHLAQGQQRRQ